MIRGGGEKLWSALKIRREKEKEYKDEEGVWEWDKVIIIKNSE